MDPLAAQRGAAAIDRAAAMTPIDIVVPVWRGADTTRRCLESILASTPRTPFELVIVNDASPEPELTGYVRELAARGVATLIEQPSPQGYAAAKKWEGEGRCA